MILNRYRSTNRAVTLRLFEQSGERDSIYKRDLHFGILHSSRGSSAVVTARNHAEIRRNGRGQIPVDVLLWDIVGDTIQMPNLEQNSVQFIFKGTQEASTSS